MLVAITVMPLAGWGGSIFISPLLGKIRRFCICSNTWGQNQAINVSYEPPIVVRGPPNVSHVQPLLDLLVRRLIPVSARPGRDLQRKGAIRSSLAEANEGIKKAGQDLDRAPNPGWGSFLLAQSIMQVTWR